MATTRTGVSSLRKLLRALCGLIARFPHLLLDPAVPAEIGIAVGALVAACLADTFGDPHDGEISGAGVVPSP